MMFELRIPENQMPTMILLFGKGFGLEVTNVPSRTFCQDVLREMAVGAKAEMCAQILRWNKENPQTIDGQAAQDSNQVPVRPTVLGRG